MAQLLSNLPIGAKVKFGKHSVNTEAAQPIIWLVVAKNHTGYPSNSVTLVSSIADIGIILIKDRDIYIYSIKKIININ